jgi:leader peptidase (prepilin peptidase)/N-methyltransferase
LEPGEPVARPVGAVVNVRDLVVGFGTVFAAALSVAVHGFTAKGIIGAAFLAVLAVLAVIDVERRVIPNRIVLPAAAAVFAAQLAAFPHHYLQWIVAPLAAAGFLFVLTLVYPAGLGMGDVKLVLLLGAGLGWSVAGALVLGSLAAALYGLGLLWRHGAEARKMPIPYGPFLALGAAVVFLL